MALVEVSLASCCSVHCTPLLFFRLEESGTKGFLFQLESVDVKAVEELANKFHWHRSHLLELSVGKQH